MHIDLSERSSNGCEDDSAHSHRTPEGSRANEQSDSYVCVSESSHVSGANETSPHWEL